MARESDEILVGGISSYVNIFFYPAAILFSFAKIKARLFHVGLFMVLVVSSIDLIFLGTRNAPAFVLLFYLFAFNLSSSFKKIANHRIEKIKTITHGNFHSKNKSFRAKRIILSLLLLFAAVFSFNYSTVNRTQEATEGNFNWLVLLEFTGSAEVLKFNMQLMSRINDSTSMLMPVIFLSHYLTHSVAEFDYLLDYSSLFGVEGAPYTTYQFCPVIKCDKDEMLQRMEFVNPRAGKYQTFFGSILIDFGYVGVIFALLSIIFFVYILTRRRNGACHFMLPIVSILILLFPVENYLYNGLGLLQILSIIPLYFLVVSFPRKL